MGVTNHLLTGMILQVSPNNMDYNYNPENESCGFPWKEPIANLLIFVIIHSSTLKG